ncbi:MAG: DUF6809 family protein [Candidatus Izemoplasmatales bacterium]
MRRTLEELYRGNISPTVKQFRRGTQYDEALRCMCKNEEKLESLLEGKEKETFDKFKACIDEVHQFKEEDAFVTGFRLGARLVIETFCEDNGFFMDIDA